MRICPHCGYEDHPMWRPRASRPMCEFTKWETLKYNDEKLAMVIKDAYPEPYFDGHFVYHISKTGLNVERIEAVLFKFMKWGQEKQERTKRTESPETSEFERAYFDLVKPDNTLDDYVQKNGGSKDG